MQHHTEARLVKQLFVPLSDSRAVPHFLSDRIMKQSVKSCTKILHCGQHALCEGALFTPLPWGVGGGWKTVSGAAAHLFLLSSSEQTETQKVWEYGGRKRLELGGRESSSSRSGAWMLSTCRVFLVVLFFFSPFCSCQEWKHRQPQQRDRKEIFNLCFEHMWYSRLQPLRGRQYMKQSLSFLCGFVRSAHCKMAVSFSKLQSFYVKGCKVLSARLQHKPVFTFDSDHFFNWITTQKDLTESGVLTFCIAELIHECVETEKQKWADKGFAILAILHKSQTAKEESLRCHSSTLATFSRLHFQSTPSWNWPGSRTRCCYCAVTH